ncbi:hypothetical protein [Lysobacter capsici]|uniref:hypothetical protein n=1 Tax=Lysobacter capsici TaxID=435897 RepID=UPI00287B67E5|nr:hypothetical protein [Lysobacter capsici]WND82617.1 hypothetical protein RJ610_09835 [Lysobacter capsici]WND87814.1 hypothetical protein RJ609_09840 [Lysobacter capsici]
MATKDSNSGGPEVLGGPDQGVKPSLLDHRVAWEECSREGLSNAAQWNLLNLREAISGLGAIHRILYLQWDATLNDRDEDEPTDSSIVPPSIHGSLWHAQNALLRCAASMVEGLPELIANGTISASAVSRVQSSEMPSGHAPCNREGG